MVSPLILLKRELRDIVDFQKYKQNYRAAKNNLDNDIERLYQFAEKEIRPIQIKTEILALIEYLNESQPKRYCEIGLAKGGTCFLISNSVKSLTRVYGIDLHIFNKRLQRFFSSGDTDVYFKTGSSTDKKVIAWLENQLATEKLDVLFIDGDHSYEGVKQDFQNYRHLVCENGLIVFHDIILDHGQKHGKQTNRYTGGVPQFYSEISAFFPNTEICSG